MSDEGYKRAIQELHIFVIDSVRAAGTQETAILTSALNGKLNEMFAKYKALAGEKPTAGPYSIGGQPWSGLSKLIEECGEVQQIAGKLIATGGEPEHWDGTDLLRCMEEEIADVYAALDFVISANGLPDAIIQARRARKLALFRRWNEQERRGEAG